MDTNIVEKLKARLAAEGLNIDKETCKKYATWCSGNIEAAIKMVKALDKKKINQIKDDSVEKATEFIDKLKEMVRFVNESEMFEKEESESCAEENQEGEKVKNDYNPNKDEKVCMVANSNIAFRFVVPVICKIYGYEKENVLVSSPRDIDEIKKDAALSKCTSYIIIPSVGGKYTRIMGDVVKYALEDGKKVFEYDCDNVKMDQITMVPYDKILSIAEDKLITGIGY